MSEFTENTKVSRIKIKTSIDFHLLTHEHTNSDTVCVMHGLFISYVTCFLTSVDPRRDNLSSNEFSDLAACLTLLTQSQAKLRTSLCLMLSKRDLLHFFYSCVRERPLRGWVVVTVLISCNRHSFPEVSTLGTWMTLSQLWIIIVI